MFDCDFMLYFSSPYDEDPYPPSDTSLVATGFSPEQVGRWGKASCRGAGDPSPSPKPPRLAATPLGDVESSPRHEGASSDGPSVKDVDSASLEEEMFPPAGERRDQALYPPSGR